MKRMLFDGEISQQSKTGFFAANDLIMAGNKWRIMNDLNVINLQEWLRLDKTKEFIEELIKVTDSDVKIAGRGRNAKTWLHPYLFIDLALYISPRLKVEVYSWLYDELIKYRNYSGDSYKKMAGALWNNCTNKAKFPETIKDTASKIKMACGVKKWELADEKQLRLRDQIHENISLLSDVLKSNEDAVRIAVLKTI